MASVTATVIGVTLLSPTSGVAALPQLDSPEWVWRLTTQGPDEIWGVPDEEGGGFRTGMWEDGAPVGVRPANDNMLDHVRGRSTWAGETADTSTRFVSTSEDPAMPWLETKYREGDIWLYKIRATKNFHSVDSAFEAVKGNPKLSGGLTEAMHLTGGEAEWLALDGIRRDQVHSAIHLDTFDLYADHFDQQKFSLRDIGLTEKDWLAFVQSDAPELEFAATRDGAALGTVRFPKQVNPHFVVPGPLDRATRDAYPIAEPTQCLMLARSPGCAVRPVPGSETDLAAVHAENLANGSSGLRFAVAEEELGGQAGAVLSPLLESRAVLDAATTPEEIRSLAADLTGSLKKDLALLDEVSTHSATVSKALAAAGKQVAFTASELMPYVAIAGTGYALSDDITNHNWVDAGFDGVAELLLIIGAAQPELMVFTEPALLVDMAAQWLVDSYRARNAPAPVMSPWQRAQAEQDHRTWTKLPETLSALRLQAMEGQLVAATEQAMRESILPSLRRRLAADRRALDALKATHILAAHQSAVRAAGGLPTGAAFEAVRADRDAAFAAIDDAFRTQQMSRAEAYAQALGDQVQVVADHFGQEWAAGSQVFEHIRTEFDREVAVPTVESAEALMSEHARFQNPPIVYPLGDLDFRRELVEGALAAYEKEFSQTFPNPLAVTMPNDATENRRLLAAVEPTTAVEHPLAWGATVPGGMTGEIAIQDPRNTLSGVMTLTVPPGTSIVSVRTNRVNQPPLSISPSQEVATIGDAETPVAFGGDGATVFVQAKAGPNAAVGSTVGGTVTIDRGTTRLSEGRLDVVVRDTIPAGHGVARPGGLTEDIAIYDPRTSTPGVMTLTAPSGTTFEQVTNNIGATNTLSADRKNATVSLTSFGAHAATVWAKLRVPAGAHQDAVFTGGRVVVTDESGVARATGALTVSTHPVTLSQTTVPSLVAGGTGDAAVRLQNHTNATTSGIAYQFTAPTNSVFTSLRVAWRNSANIGGTDTGAISDDGRTLTFSNDSLTIGANGWVTLTVKLRAAAGSSGTIADGVFAVTGGGILPTGDSTPLAYTAVVTRIPTVSGEAGPGKTVELTIYDPRASVTGTMTLEAPAGGTFAMVTNNMGAAVTYSADRKKATIGRAIFGGAAATVRARVTLPATAVPTTSYGGTVTITDGNTIVATGTLSVYTSIDGCLTAEEQAVPISLVIWFFPVVLRNNCYADIDVRVHFGGGPDSGWATVPAKSGVTPGSAAFWSTPYARYDHYEIGNVSRP